MKPIKSLNGANIAIVALGNSQVDYAIGAENSMQWDEVWTVNSAAAVYKSDRMFMLDPASRFLDGDDALNAVHKFFNLDKNPVFDK